ncbi:MAG: D-aminoacyl-tRNA deacylase [Bacteroidota bacterium]
MRALIQRVKKCQVHIDGKLFSGIGQGMLILLGVKKGDSEEDAHYLADRCAALRIFEDQREKMNLSVKDIGGSAMVVSQFTLYADTRRGNRPGFTDAAPPEIAEGLYEKFVQRLRGSLGESKVSSGVFRAMMDVELVNYGPVTVMIESKSDTSGQSEIKS